LSQYVQSGEVESVMLPCGLIEDRIEKMAQEILTRALAEGEGRPGGVRLTLLCVLKGASRFFHHLVGCMERWITATGAPIRLDFEYVKVGGGAKGQSGPGGGC
jgi:hypoxanthine-guanine phosphoribosyltransferase